MGREPIGVWSWRMPDSRENFGDALGPLILERLGLRVRRVSVRDAELVACGSILHKLTNPATVVWGSGLMHPLPLWAPPRTVLAARGAHTAAYLGVDVPLGDPGLLVGALWERSPVVKHRLGVVPHWLDRRPYPDADTVIDVTRPVDEVIAQITSCAVVASSSLHGIAVADSFGIPSMRLPYARTGGEDIPYVDYKFTDYLTALDRPLPEIQTALVDALRAVY
ncbi:hypothetical protein [Streptomyces sp. NPDC059468]|uniref:hypothetical protein n=2 Tax=unclassified Streptomyces TaxID=2593676 RepID=UPI0036C4687F